MNSTFKKIIKLVLIIAVCVHLGPVIVWLVGLAGYMSKSSSFVGYINTPSFSNTEKLLNELNTKGSGEVVKSLGLRPIFIFEDNLNKRKRFYINDEGKKSYYNVLGLTWALPGYCLILMDKKLDKELYKTTLWHEYLHCFYYGHSDDNSDIMYHSNVDMLREDSINTYLEELKEIYE